MHEFVADHEAFERTELRHWSPTVTGRNTIVFKVFGTDVEAYEATLAEAECILSYELSQLPGDSFFIVVDEQLDAAGTGQTAVVTRGGLVVVPPVVFDDDGTVSMTLVGADEALQSAVEQLPESHGLGIVRIRECTGSRGASAGSLSPHQYEAVEAAVDCGYYREPRVGAVAGVTAWFDCSMSTATEHLRKVEVKVTADLVGRPQLRVGSRRRLRL